MNVFPRLNRSSGIAYNVILYGKGQSVGRKTMSGEPKNSQLLIRLNTSERARIDAEATKKGLAPSAWARQILLENAPELPVKKRQSKGEK